MPQSAGLLALALLVSCVSGETGWTTKETLDQPVITTVGTASATVAGYQASVPAQPGATFGWSITNGTLTGPTNGPTVTYTAGAVGNLTLTCAESSPVGTVQGTGTVKVVTDSGQPVAPTITAPPVLVQGQGEETVSTQPQPNSTYDWTILGGTIDSGQGTPTVAFELTPAAAAQLRVGGAVARAGSAGATLSVTVKNKSTSASTTATVIVPVTSVTDQAPTNLVYKDNPAVYTLGQKIDPNTHTSQGGSVLSYSLFSGSLPQGLGLDPSGNGNIVGTPTALAGPTPCIITATNNAGHTDANLTISVQAPVSQPGPLTVSITGPTQPVLAGTPWTLTATAAGGAGPYTYQWNQSGVTTPVQTGTTNTYGDQQAKLTEAGQYTVTVTDQSTGQVATSAPVTLTVNPAPLSVSITPPSQGVVTGASWKLSAVVVGTGPYTYQWNKVGASTPVPNGTSSSIGDLQAQLAEAGEYTVTVTDQTTGETATCAPATLAVTPKLTVSITAVAPTVLAGTNWSFTAVPASGTGPYTYQWNHSVQGVPTPVQNGPLSSYGDPKAKVTEAGAYTVTVTDQGTGQTAISAPVTLTVTPVPLNVTITTTTPTVIAGNTWTFVASVAGIGPYTYQWSQNGTTPAGTASSIGDPQAQLTEAGSYTVTVTDQSTLETATSPAVTLTVTPKLTVSITSPTSTVTAGTPWTFTAAPASGTGPYTYQWTQTLQGVATPFGASSSIGDQKAKVTEAGAYTVTVTDQGTGQTATSAAVTLTVNSVQFSVSLVPGNQTVTAATPWSLTAAPAGGLGPFTYVWTQTVQNVATTVQNGNLSTYGDQKAKVAESGSYTVTVTDQSTGETATSAAATLLVNQATLTVSITTLTPTVTAGTPWSFAAAPVGVGPYTYQWNQAGVGTAVGTSTSIGDPKAKVTEAGAYTVTVTDQTTGLTATSTAVTLTVTPVTLTVSIATTTTSVTAGTPWNFTATVVGVGPYTYQWTQTAQNVATTVGTSSSLGDQTAKVTEAGSYLVTVTDQSTGETATSAAVTLTVNRAPFTASITTTTPTVTAGTAWSFAATTTGGTGPYTYQWTQTVLNVPTVVGTSGTLGDQTAKVTEAGSYTVQVTDQGTGETATSAAVLLTVTPRPNFTVSITTTTPTVTAGTSWTFTAAPAGGLGPYTYQWSQTVQNLTTPVPNGSSSSYGDTKAKVTEAGPYTVMITDQATGQTATSTAVTLTVNPAPLTVSITTTTPAVVAGTAWSFTATVAGVGPYTYQWTQTAQNLTTPAGTTSSIGDLQAQASEAGSYTVKVSDLGTGETATSAATTLTVNPVLTVSITTTTPTVIAGSAWTFTAAPVGTAPYTYQWNKAGTSVPNATSSSYGDQQAQLTDAGAYTVTVKDNTGQSVTSAPTTLTVTPKLTVTITTTTPAVVAGSAWTFTAAPVGTGPYTYAWSQTVQGVTSPVPNGFSASIGDPQALLTEAGAYTVLVTDHGTGQTATSVPVTLTVTPKLTVSITAAASTVNAGTPWTFTAAPASGTGPYTYEWVQNATPVPNGSSSSVGDQKAKVSEAGAYTVTVTDQGTGQTATSAALTLAVTPVTLTVTITTTTPTVIAGSPWSFAATVAGIGPYTYQWTQTVQNVATPVGTSSSIGDLQAQLSEAGSYTVMVTDQSTGETASSTSVTLTVTPKLTVSITPANQTVNAGTPWNLTAAPASGTGPYTYQWTQTVQGVATSVQNGPSSGYGDAKAKITEAGTYTVTATDQGTGQTASSAGAVLQVTPVPLSVSLSSANVTVLAGNAWSLTATGVGVGPFTYQWSQKVQGVTSPAGTSSTLGDQVAQTSETGTYTVAVLDQSTGETVTSPPVTVTVTPKLTVSITPANSAVTAGTPWNLTATPASGTGPYTYQWLQTVAQGPTTVQNGASNSYGDAKAKITEAGSYTVTVMDLGSGQTATSAPVTLAVTPAPFTVTLAPNTQTVTAGTPWTLTATAAGVGPYTYQWNQPGTAAQNGASLGDPQAKVTEAGSYTVTVTDQGTGQTATSASATLAVTPASLTVAIAPPTLTVAVGNRWSLAATVVGVGPYTYQWTQTAQGVTTPVPNGASSSIGDATGQLTETGSYTVKVTDLGTGQTFSASATLTVSQGPVGPSGLTYANPAPTYNLGTAIPPNLPTLAQGGGSGVVFSATGLPAGLLLDPNTGAISGIPTALQNAVPCTVTATNAALNASTSTNPPLSITVGRIPVPSYGQSTLTFSLGVATTYRPTNAGAPATQGWSINPSPATLPTGLTFSSSDGTLGGTPAAALAAPLQYTVSAVGDNGTGTVTFNLTTALAAPVISYGNNTNDQSSGFTFNGGSQVTLTPQNAGGAPDPNGWSLSAPVGQSATLPNGLTFSTQTGFISGTAPTVGSTAVFIVTARNQAGNGTTRFALTIKPPPAPVIGYSSNGGAATSSLFTFTGGDAISLTPVNTGGDPDPNGWSLTTPNGQAVTLPNGLLFNNQTGVLSGQAPLAGFNGGFLVTAHNGGGNGTTTFTLNVNSLPQPAVTYATGTLPLTPNVVISPLVPVNTGGPATRYALNANSPHLPGTLSLDPATGVITGLAPVTPQTVYSIDASNDAGTCTAQLTLWVDGTPAFSYGTETINLDSDVMPGNYAPQISPANTGGGATLWSISPDATNLPGGLAFNPANGNFLATGPEGTFSSPSFFPKKTFTVTAVNGNLGSSDPSVTTATALVSFSIPNRGPGYSSQITTPLGYPSSPYTCYVGNPVFITPAFPPAPGNTLPEGSFPTGMTYSVDAQSSLPPGLTLDPATAVISGTPTAAYPQTTVEFDTLQVPGDYAFQNAAQVTIQVLDQQPAPPAGLAYAPNPVTVTVGVPATPSTPTSTGGPIFNYEVSPSLPDGLSLDPHAGTITGTPLSDAALTLMDTYMVTASNVSGSTTASVVIQVGAVFSYPSELICTVGVAGSPVLPTVGPGAAIGTFSCTDLPDGLSIDPTTGAIGGTPTGPQSSGYCTVTSGTATAPVLITVLPSPTAPVGFTYQPAVLNLILQSAGQTAVPTSTGGQLLSNFATTPALPSGLSIDADTGVISGAPQAVSPQTTYTVTAQAFGNPPTPVQATIQIAVSAPDTPPLVSYGSNNLTFMAGVFTSVTPTVQGGVTQLQFVGQLPSGLQFNQADGTIYGTPTVFVSRPFFVTVNAFNGPTLVSSVYLTLTVLDQPPAISYPPGPLFFNTDTFTSYAPTSVGGQVTGWSADAALPAGLSLNGTTGVLAGVPTVPGPVGLHITASNGTGSVTVPVALNVVLAGPQVTYGASTLVFPLGKAGRITPVVTNDTVAAWAISPTPLPAGLYLDPATGAIYGTATAATATPCTVMATDAQGLVATVPLNLLVVLLPPSITYLDNALNFPVGVTSAFQPGNHGSPATQWQISPSTLPGGVQFSTSTGSFSGSPQAGDTLDSPATYTITASNAAGQSVVQVSLTVNSTQPSVDYGPTPLTFPQGAATTFPPRNGGVTSAWSASGLPGGITVNPTTGALNGTLNVSPGSSAAAITIGTTSVASPTFQMGTGAPVIAYPNTALVFPNGVTATFTPSNSGGPIACWSLSGTLPPGVFFDQTDGTLSGTCTTIAAPVPVIITARSSAGTSVVNLTLAVNDLAPTAFSYPTPPALSAGSMLTISPIIAGGTGLTFEVDEATPLPTGLSINSSTGVISGQPGDPSNGTYNIIATNGLPSGQNTFTTLVTIQVNGAPPSITYGGDTREGDLHLLWPSGGSFTPVNTGGRVKIWTITQGGNPVTLPPMEADGVTPEENIFFDTSSGTLSGYQIYSNNYPVTWPINGPTTYYTITATNDFGSVTDNVTLTLNGPGPETPEYPNAFVFYTGLTIPSTPLTFRSGLGSEVTWRALQLPSGLDIGTYDATLNGTPTSGNGGLAGYTVLATVSYQFASGSGSYPETWNVNIWVKDLVPTSLAYTTEDPVYVAGQTIAMNSPVVAPLPAYNGGTAPYTYSFDQLPAGLTMDGSGNISGLPTTAGTTPCTITVTSNTGHSITHPMNITVSPAPPALPALPQLSYLFQNCTQFAAFSTIVANLRVVPDPTTTFRYFPALSGFSWLTEDSSHNLIASPSAVPGTYTFLVLATNASGTAEGFITFTVLPGAAYFFYPTAYPSNSISFTQNLGIAPPLTPTVVGGVAVTWHSSPPLPNGLSFATDGSGTITGASTVTTNGPTPFVITATFGDGTTASVTLTMNILPGGPVLTTLPSDQTVTVGSQATLAAWATGSGQLTFVWHKVSYDPNNINNDNYFNDQQVQTHFVTPPDPSTPVQDSYAYATSISDGVSRYYVTVTDNLQRMANSSQMPPTYGYTTVHITLPTPSSVDFDGNGHPLALVAIPNGGFQMGDPSYSNPVPAATPTEPVTISTPFYMATYLMSKATYNAILGNGTYLDLPGTDPLQPSAYDLPMGKVSITDLETAGPTHLLAALNASTPRILNQLLPNQSSFLTQAPYNTWVWRLPTEAEWEYAYRAGTQTDYLNGYGLDDPTVTNIWFWDSSDSNGVPHSWQDQIVPGTNNPLNAWGLGQMAGDLAEWVQDYYGNYQYYLLNDWLDGFLDPVGPTQGPADGTTARVIRSGSYQDPRDASRAFTRQYQPDQTGTGATTSENLRLPWVGFRVVFGPPLTN